MSISITNINNQTGHYETREMTEDELIELNETRENFQAEKQARLEKQSVNLLAKAELLNRLGITEEEANLLAQSL